LTDSVVYTPEITVVSHGLAGSLAGFDVATNRGATMMTWETPTFVEVKMDAEINSYQDDSGEDRDTGV
jgi:hypothetical protein